MSAQTEPLKQNPFEQSPTGKKRESEEIKPDPKDELTADLNQGQREYIMEEIYPLLKKTLIQFMNKSLETDHYKTKMKTKSAIANENQDFHRTRSVESFGVPR